MQCIIDRFEGDFAVIEYDDKTFNLPIVFLPEGVAEGDALEIVVTVDNEKKEILKAEVDKLVEDLWEK